MRDGLLPYWNKRTRFRATFVKKSRNPKSSLWLFKDIKLPDGESICDHLWLDRVRRLRELKLKRGDVIEFNAIVMTYWRSNGSSDFRLSAIEQVRRVPRAGLET